MYNFDSDRKVSSKIVHHFLLSFIYSCFLFHFRTHFKEAVGTVPNFRSCLEEAFLRLPKRLSISPSGGGCFRKSTKSLRSCLEEAFSRVSKRLSISPSAGRRLFFENQQNPYKADSWRSMKKKAVWCKAIWGKGNRKGFQERLCQINWHKKIMRKPIFLVGNNLALSVLEHSKAEPTEWM